LRGVEEKRVVVAADKAIEGSEFLGRKALGVPRCDMVILQGSLSAHVPDFKHAFMLRTEDAGKRERNVLCNLQSRTVAARTLVLGSCLA